MTGDGGMLLLREMDRRLGLTEFIAACLSDKRRKTGSGTIISACSGSASMQSVWVMKI